MLFPDLTWSTSWLLWSFLGAPHSIRTLPACVPHHCPYTRHGQYSILVSYATSFSLKLDHELPGTSTMPGLDLNAHSVHSPPDVLRLFTGNTRALPHVAEIQESIQHIYILLLMANA